MTETLPPAPDHDRIEPVDIQQEMQRSYIDYAMSVIVSRALPDVRDGLKPVHRRVLYSMFDSGFRPDRGYNKCSRVVGDVMGNYHPHGDSAIYDALVRLAQPWSMRYPLIDGQGNFGSPGNDPAAAMRYTESRLAPLAMQMLAGIDEDTVDFSDNYDGRTQEPDVLPSRFPNLLVNGGSGIAVGMATNIPPHNLREVADGVAWPLETPEASDDELLAALLVRVKGPDFPTKAMILGTKGIEDAYRTGRGSVRMRAVVEVEEDAKGRTILVVSELPYQVNPDNLVENIASLVRDAKLTGIADIADESNSRSGMRIVITLRRDAVAKVVLNNLFKHSQLQQNFGVNMLALVDGVPRTLRLDQIIRHYVKHQVEVIVRRTRFRLKKAEERAHILRGYVKALDALDDVVVTITRTGYAKRTKTDLYRSQKRGGKGVQGATLKQDDIVQHFFVCSTHDWILFFTNKGRVYRTKAYELPEANRNARGQHVANLMAFQPDEQIAQVIQIKNYEVAPYLVLATKRGLVKKTKLTDFDSNRSGGLIAINLREGDELVGAVLAGAEDDLLLVSAEGQSIRFHATDEALRPM